MSQRFFWLGVAGRLLLCCLASLPLTAHAADPTAMTIRYFQTDLRYAYRIELLRLALNETREDGPFVLEPIPEAVTQNRGLQLLASNRIDVAFLPTSVEREQRLRPVRIPMLRGLLGYRVLLIQDQDRDRFRDVQSLDQLRQFTGGFGTQWADMAILRHNRLKIQGVANYDALFEMLSWGRFDYFPRGVNEAWNELAERRDALPHLMVEPHIALYYPYPVYFFVNRDNEALAARIEKGLRRALESGAFRELFLKYHQDAIDRARIPERTLLRLENPLLPPGTPPIDTHWWLPEP